MLFIVAAASVNYVNTAPYGDRTMSQQPRTPVSRISGLAAHYLRSMYRVIRDRLQRLKRGVTASPLEQESIEAVRLKIYLRQLESERLKQNTFDWMKG